MALGVLGIAGLAGAGGEGGLLGGVGDFLFGEAPTISGAERTQMMEPLVRGEQEQRQWLGGFQAQLGQERAGALGGYQPFIGAGEQGLGMLGRGAAGYEQLLQQPGAMTPGGQFALEQGVGAMERGAAARGTQLSGGQLQELQTFGQGVAMQDYQQQLQNQMSLAGLGMQQSQMGLGALGQQGQLGLGYSQLGGQVGTQMMGNIGTLQGGQAQIQAALAQSNMQAQSQQQAGMMGIVGMGVGGFLGGMGRGGTT